MAPLERLGRFYPNTAASVARAGTGRLVLAQPLFLHSARHGSMFVCMSQLMSDSP